MTLNMERTHGTKTPKNVESFFGGGEDDSSLVPVIARRWSVSDMFFAFFEFLRSNRRK